MKKCGRPDCQCPPAKRGRRPYGAVMSSELLPCGCVFHSWSSPRTPPAPKPPWRPAQPAQHPTPVRTPLDGGRPRSSVCKPRLPPEPPPTPPTPPTPAATAAQPLLEARGQKHCCLALESCPSRVPRGELAAEAARCCYILGSALLPRPIYVDSQQTVYCLPTSDGIEQVCFHTVQFQDCQRTVSWCSCDREKQQRLVREFSGGQAGSIYSDGREAFEFHMCRHAQTLQVRVLEPSHVRCVCWSLCTFFFQLHMLAPVLHRLSDKCWTAILAFLKACVPLVPCPACVAAVHVGVTCPGSIGPLL